MFLALPFKENMPPKKRKLSCEQSEEDLPMCTRKKKRQTIIDNVF